MTFNGNAKVSEDAEKGKVLKLDGSDGTYAEFPKGLFDGRNKLTVQMDVKSEINKNQFTFAFGQNSTKYYFLKYNNSGELASRITTNSYGAEDAANATLSGNGAWHRVTVTLDDNVMTVYSDGAQVAQNKATKNKVTDLGNDLLAYLGKSFYNDPYFKGSFDNVNVWNRALTAQEVEKTSRLLCRVFLWALCRLTRTRCVALTTTLRCVPPSTGPRRPSPPCSTAVATRPRCPSR